MNGFLVVLRDGFHCGEIGSMRCCSKEALFRSTSARIRDPPALKRSEEC